MINIILLPIYAFVTLCLYLWHFKSSDIEIGLIKGFVLGCSITTVGDEYETNYLDFYLGIVIITFIWDR